jgi:hypothetical protein
MAQSVQLAQLAVQAQTFLGTRPWTVSLVLQTGAHLAQAVQRFPGLSGQQKSSLVCQTILQLLEDGEKADRERLKESTPQAEPTIPWEECKRVVATVLPATLTLLVSAARGEIDLRKPSGWANLCCFAAAAFASTSVPVRPSQASLQPAQTLVVRQVASPLQHVAQDSPKALELQEVVPKVPESLPKEDVPSDKL